MKFKLFKVPDVAFRVVMVTATASIITGGSASASELRVIPPRAEVVTALNGFTNLAASQGFSESVIKETFDSGLTGLRSAITAFDTAGFIPQRDIFDAYNAFSSMFTQITFGSVGAIADYRNALGSLRRAAMVADVPDATRIIVHGQFLNAYLYEPQRRKVSVFAAETCRERGFQLAMPLDDIPCSMPASDTIRCNGVFECAGSVSRDRVSEHN